MSLKTTPFFLIFLLTAFFRFGASGQVLINEYSVSNLSNFPDNYGEYEDWVELYNAGSAAVSLAGYYLSDDSTSPLKWQIPNGVTIPAGGFLKFWASGRDTCIGSNYHMGFKLQQTKGEYIVLTDLLGNTLDCQPLRITQVTHSWGRKPNGSTAWFIFTSPTPGTTNNNATGYSRYADKPVMSQAAGFYSAGFPLTISTSEPNAVIRYTLNGNEPVTTSTAYGLGLSISATTLVKARTFSNDPTVLPSLIEFNTYFINSTYSLPVVSVGANTLLELLNGNSSLLPHGSIEYFDTSGTRTNIGYGDLNKHGQDSWVHPQRSIDYVMRDEYGYNHDLHGKFFSWSDRENFQHVILRAAGDDNYPGIDTSAHLRDIFVENLASEGRMNLDMRRGQRIILYANGTYWGVYALREKVDDCDYTDYYYGQGRYDIEYVLTWGGTWAEYGGQQALNDWAAMRTYILNNNMNNAVAWDYVTSHYDYKSLADYVITNSYVVCSDWLNWNVGVWRGLNPSGGHRKWGYILWDEDATFGHYINYTGVPAQSPTVSPCFPESLTGAWQDPEGNISILNKLRTNPEFEQYYVSRYMDLMNTLFSCSHMQSTLDSIAAVIDPEMPRHFIKWGGNLTQWHNNVQKVRNFIGTRCNYVSNGLKSCYGLTGPYAVTLDAGPAGRGGVQINSLTLTQFPWSGNYYGGMVVKLKAIESDPSWEFDRWILNHHTVFPSDTAHEVTLSLTMGDSIYALFKPKVFLDSLVINEINYKSAASSNAEDWIEFYNPMPYALNIGNWEFKDSDNGHVFTFPANTVIPSYGYLVLSRDTATFHSVFPTVTNVVGNLGFGLSSSGELLRLFNSTGVLIDTVHYLPTAPWPTTPNGNGPTLELISPNLDNALPQSWMASPVNGTPGAMNSFATSLPKPQDQPEKVSMDVYPNPFSSTATIRIKTRSGSVNGRLMIFNTLGIPVRSIDQVTDPFVQFNKGSLSPGVYLLRYLGADGQKAGSARMVVE